MSRSASRAWAVLCLLGIAIWIGVTVAVAVVNDDPSDGGPVLLAFAGGGAAFFGAVFAVAWWQTRPRSDPELDALLAELAVEPATVSDGARAIGAMRRMARLYIALGALVTALGLLAIVEEGLGFGSPRGTLYAIVAIVAVWALAVPFALRRANAASAAVLEPLGLQQAGATLRGERHGRRVSVEITAHGSLTRLDAEVPATAASGAELAPLAGRGDARIWDGVSLEAKNGQIRIRRQGQDGASWLWDLWLAERLAAEA